MGDDVIATTVVSTSTEVPGRTLNTARHNHFVIDSPSGPGEALATGEAFLSGISACGVTLVQAVANERDISIDRLSVSISGVRLASNPIDFDHIDVSFTYRGPSLQQAQDLTATWQAR
jgi:uncharacterized OsmC-like protein